MQPSLFRFAWAGDFTHFASMFFHPRIYRFPSVYGILFHPILIEFTQEIMFVHAHFIACGIAMVLSVISIVFLVRRELAKKVTYNRKFSLECELNRKFSMECELKSARNRVIYLGLACAVLLMFNVVKFPSPFSV